MKDCLTLKFETEMNVQYALILARSFSAVAETITFLHSSKLSYVLVFNFEHRFFIAIR